MATLELVDVTVADGARRVLQDVNLHVADGERVAVLGPSGAGKSTLLRTVAGLVQPEHGQIRFDGEDLTHVPGPERGVALIAQGGGLLPHRDVAGNIALPLEVRHVPRTEVDRRVRAQARAFAIDDLLARRGSALSAGETAEVLLARTLVRRPSVALMDEPFSRIDSATRTVLLRDIIRTQEGYGTTLLIATNDHRTAASVAHRIAVIGDGRLVQTGSVAELIEQPATLEVAALCADGVLNVLPGRLVRERGTTVLVVGGWRVPTWQLALGDHGPGSVQVAIRPSDLSLRSPDAPHTLAGRVVRHAFLGAEVDVTVATEDAQFTVRCPRPAPQLGEHVRLALPLDRLHVFDPSGRAIAHRV